MIWDIVNMWYVCYISDVNKRIEMEGLIMEYEYLIDLDWSNEEMILVINFFNYVEKYYEFGVMVGDFMGVYKRFKEIVFVKVEEK